jgi:ribonuclease MRP protein subunit RMP1
MANNKPNPTNKQPPDLSILHASHSHLSTAAQLLDGFVHRNKNQHRATRWWGPFDMLRRSVRKLIPDLEDAVKRAEYLSSSSSSIVPAKRRKTNDKGAVAKLPPELEKVQARAQWVHDVIAVKAYV